MGFSGRVAVVVVFYGMAEFPLVPLLHRLVLSTFH
jgi:hypothetical protein